MIAVHDGSPAGRWVVLSFRTLSGRWAVLGIHTVPVLEASQQQYRTIPGTRDTLGTVHGIVVSGVGTKYRCV